MSLPPLNPDDDYQLSPAPAPAILDKDRFNALVLSLSLRMKTVEATKTILEDLIADISFTAQQRVDEVITPILNTLSAQVAQTQAEAAAIISDFQAVTAVNLEALEASIADAESSIADISAQFDTILAGGLPAAQVEESLTRVFLTPAQKAEIGQLRTDLGGAVSALEASILDRLTNTTYI